MRRITRKTVKAVSTWRAVAASVKIPHREIELMAGALEHAALKDARGYGG
jgi:hypothetical protein